MLNPHDKKEDYYKQPYLRRPKSLQKGEIVLWTE